MQLKLTVNETELLIKSLTEQSGSLKLNLKAICSFEVFHSSSHLLINKINITNEKLEQQLQSVSWSLAEFRHNKIVQSPHENYFNVCRQHKEK